MRDLYRGDGWHVPRLLDAMDASEDFYFDSISQVVLDRWSRGRVALVGDAAYSPGPAVGGGTSLAVVGAYVLAQQLSSAVDVTAGLLAYEREMRDTALAFRRIGPATMKSLIPRTRGGALTMPYLLNGVAHLPEPLVRRLGTLQATPARALSSTRLEPPAPSERLAPS